MSRGFAALSHSAGKANTAAALQEQCHKGKADAPGFALVYLTVQAKQMLQQYRSSTARAKQMYRGCPGLPRDTGKADTAAVPQGKQTFSGLPRSVSRYGQTKAAAASGSAYLTAMPHSRDRHLPA
jgi:hypothetical protein